MPSTVFVTGATGFIGGWVARKLLERGDRVIALARGVAKAQPLSEMGCQIALGDLANEDALWKAMERADAVVHAAANVSMGLVDPKQMWEDNVGGTERVLRAAQAREVPRIVVVSSVDHFGGAGGRLIDETHERAPTFSTVYEFTKHHATRLAFQAHREAGAPVTVVYPGRTLGPEDPNFGPLFDVWASGRLLAFLGLGAYGTYSHVEDVAEGVLLALDKGRAGEGYIVADAPRSWGELFALAGHIAGVPAPRADIPRALALPAARLVQWLFQRTKLIPPVKGGQPPLSVELVRGATELSARHSSRKIKEELGWRPRPFHAVLEEVTAFHLARAGRG